MFASFPSTMLRTDQRAVKDAASAEPVLVTNKDNRNLVLCGLERFRESLDQRRAERTFDDRVMEAVERGLADFEAGRYVTGSVDEVITEMERRRLAHG